MEVGESKGRTERPASRSLTVLANCTAAFPVFALGTLYGQWILSWWILGRRPRPSLDDPKFIDGASWMGYVSGIALMMYLPMLFGAIFLNAWHSMQHQTPALRSSLRIGVVVGIWLAALLLLRADPGDVVSWWLD